MRVVVFIRHLRRWGPWRRRSRCRRGFGSSCSSRASAVRVDESAVAGADAGRGVHRGPPPFGSRYPPSPARSRVSVCMVFVLPAFVDGDGVDRVHGSARAPGPGEGQPFGSMPPPPHARSRVIKFIADSIPVMWLRCAIGVQPGPIAGADLRSGAHRCASVKVGTDQPPPSGSMAGPSPARICVWVLMVSPWVDGSAAAAVRVDPGSVAGANAAVDLHCLLPGLARGGRDRG